eukprot:TRINITY_DN12287_c0_g1_i3.p1 TRINITY_DN12287_c0_g1~~TRINITY_DN12287_c0_g1_i3.p1  ORF type:complete len:329 (-),score=89.92 TRINITY_DN12287_c0_g1_i3:75-1061(-)
MSDFFFFQAEDGIRDLVRSRGLGDVYKRQVLVSGGDDKTVKAWSTKDWSLIRGCTMAKKVTSVVVTKDGSRVAGADKFGDVYSLELSNDAPAELCLGHMSIITAMALSPCNSLVVTADRDSTIRCSCFPDGYNIESFCLGHATYVSQLLISPSHPDFLFSADGSAELILWKYKTGDLVQRHKFEGEDLSLVGIAFCPATNVLAASMSDKSIVFIRFDGETLDLDHVHRLESPHVLSALNFGADGSLWAAACAVDDKQQPTTHLTVFESKSTPESLLFSPVEEGHAAHATVSVVNADVKTCLESGVVAGVENKRAPKRFKEGNKKTDEK